MQTEPSATELVRFHSQQERWARALAEAEADAAQQEAAGAEAELAVVEVEVARLATAQLAARAVSAEGTIARAIREQSRPWRWPSRRCRTALQAAQLRLSLGLLHSERLTEHCPLVLEAGRVTDIIVSCWKVPLTPIPCHDPLPKPTPLDPRPLKKPLATSHHPAARTAHSR